jgi:hypothetical protein
MVSAALCALALGCGGGTTGPAADTISATTGGDAGDKGSEGADAGSTDPEADAGTFGQSVTLTLDAFDVAPGAEVYKCQNFANPFGADVDVQRFESDMTPGSHHLILFYLDGAQNGPLTDCSGLEFASTPYVSQSAHDELTYPQGAAALFPASKGLRLQAHYLNTGTTTVHATVSATLTLPADPASIVHQVKILFVPQINIVVPPKSTVPVTGSFSLPADITMLSAASHMHKHGTNFIATAGDRTLFQTTQWESPNTALFPTPIALSKGQNITFTCTFVNDGDTTLTFGESAQTNEMCIFIAPFY